MSEARHTIWRTSDGKRSVWQIAFLPKGYAPCKGVQVVFEYPWRSDDAENGEPPEPVRREYERLVGYDPATFKRELDTDDRRYFNQPCKWAGRFDADSETECRNPTWLYARIECKRWPDDQPDCAGFCPNPAPRTP